MYSEITFMFILDRNYSIITLYIQIRGLFFLLKLFLLQMIFNLKYLFSEVLL